MDQMPCLAPPIQGYNEAGDRMPPMAQAYLRAIPLKAPTANSHHWFAPPILSGDSLPPWDFSLLPIFSFEVQDPVALLLSLTCLT